MSTRKNQTGLTQAEQTSFIQAVIELNTDSNENNNKKGTEVEAYVGTAQKVNLLLPWRVAQHFAFAPHVANNVEQYKPSKEPARKTVSKFDNKAQKNETDIIGKLYLLRTRDTSITKKIGPRTRIVKWLYMRFPAIMGGAAVHYFIQEGMKSPPPSYMPYRGKEIITAGTKVELAKLGTKK